MIELCFDYLPLQWVWVFIFFHCEGFFCLQDVQDIFEGTDQRSCVVNISWLRYANSISAVSENVIFHLQRQKLQPLSYWRENDDIKCITIVHDFQHVGILFLLLVFFFCFILI